MQSTGLLVGEGLSRRFGGVLAVSEVSFTLHEGEVLGVLGPNGAGKTTLFSIIGGGLRASAGSLTLAGTQLVGRPTHRFVHAGICRTHQIPRPFDTLDVEENVRVAQEAGAGRRKYSSRASLSTVELLDMVGLEGQGQRLTSELTLSGRKRLEIARALATGPRVLLLDEAAAGLNETECDLIVDVIRNVRDAGVSIMMTEHIMSVAKRVCDRILILNKGEKIADGLPQEVMAMEEVVTAYLGRT